MDSSKQMTSGNPAKLILFFAIPLMIGNIFQQLYTMVDTMIVGQVLGVSALAALGSADWLIWLVQGIITGMTQGFSIQVSQDYSFDHCDDHCRFCVLSASVKVNSFDSQYTCRYYWHVHEICSCDFFRAVFSFCL